LEDLHEHRLYSMSTQLQSRDGVALAQDTYPLVFRKRRELRLSLGRKGGRAGQYCVSWNRRGGSSEASSSRRGRVKPSSRRTGWDRGRGRHRGSVSGVTCGREGWIGGWSGCLRCRRVGWVGRRWWWVGLDGRRGLGSRRHGGNPLKGISGRQMVPRSVRSPSESREELLDSHLEDRGVDDVHKKHRLEQGVRQLRLALQQLPGLFWLRCD
jgi:hypothetical protein